MRENSEERWAFHVSKAIKHSLSALLVNCGCLLKSHWEAILVPTMMMWGKIQPFMLLWGKRWVAWCSLAATEQAIYWAKAQSHGTDLNIWCYISSFHNASQHLRKHLSRLFQMFPSLHFWHREKYSRVSIWGIWDTIRNQGCFWMPEGKGFRHTEMKSHFFQELVTL